MVLETGSRRVVMNEDGYLVDLETGEVLEESPLCYDARCEAPPGLSREEWERRARAAPVTRRRRRVREPQPRVQMQRVVTFKLPRDLADKLDLAVLEGLGTKSGIIRAALRAYLEGGADLVAARGLGERLRRLAYLYSARGFLYAAQYMIRMARAYTHDKPLLDDLKRIDDELEAAISHYNGAISDTAKKLGLW